jgi:hypothetical protein
LIYLSAWQNQPYIDALFIERHHDALLITHNVL